MTNDTDEKNDFLKRLADKAGETEGKIYRVKKLGKKIEGYQSPDFKDSEDLLPNTLAKKSCTCDSVCTCDAVNAQTCGCDCVCTCDGVCTCDSECSCDGHCSCDSVCTCDNVSNHYWYPN